MPGPRNAPLDWKTIRNNAAKFAITYKNASKESSLKQSFWIDFMAIFDVDAKAMGAFEWAVKCLGENTKEIDYFWPGKVLIEHKSRGMDLMKALDQAYNYIELINRHNDETRGREPKVELPEYIIVSDFANIILLSTLPGKTSENVSIKLADLPDNIDRFAFLAGYENREIEGQHPVNVRAATMMAHLYDLLKESGYPEDKLDVYLIRLVFCMFAEDSGIFEKNQFTNFVYSHSSSDGIGFGAMIQEVFSVLDIPEDKRQARMSDALRAFEYVDGGLFAETLPIAQFDKDMVDGFYKVTNLDWKYISPAIFGSMFQGIMDPKLRRALGAHYTSEENILKLINPLFMDDLWKEFETIKANKNKLKVFWDKIANIRVFDPACGCGNFLVIAYRELRKLEMEVMDAITGKQAVFDTTHLKVSNFYGIEIESFPAQIANVSILLMEHLMNQVAEKRFGVPDKIVPLTQKANVICDNSLRVDWNEVCPKDRLTYIIGNPPFIGHQNRTKKQIEDMDFIFNGFDKAGKLDYVCAWYKKAVEFMKDTHIKAAFVSTNSIAQGESAYIMGTEILKDPVKITFAHRTFVWKNEAKNNAAVHCVIIGFSYDKGNCYIFDGDTRIKAENINCYLIDAPNIYVESRLKTVNNLPAIIKGSQPTGTDLLLSPQERDEIVTKYPQSSKFIRRFIGADEFINNYERYCLWLVDAKPSEYIGIPPIKERLEKVAKQRAASPTKSVQRDAATPGIFTQIRQPDVDYLVIPRHSTSNRTYIPFGYVSKDVIAGDAVSIIPTDDLFVFGIITSRMHMAWIETISGRIKSDFRYSPFVYNSFPIPDMNESAKNKIRELSQAILDCRASYEGQSLADLYNVLAMPPDLVKAHHKLDQAIDRLYSKTPFKDDGERGKLLLHLYADIINSKKE